MDVRKGNKKNSGCQCSCSSWTLGKPWGTFLLQKKPSRWTPAALQEASSYKIPAEVLEPRWCKQSSFQSDEALIFYLKGSRPCFLEESFPFLRILVKFDKTRWSLPFTQSSRCRCPPELSLRFSAVTHGVGPMLPPRPLRALSCFDTAKSASKGCELYTRLSVPGQKGMFFAYLFVCGF